MLIRILVNWLILAVAIGVAAAVVPGIDVHGGFLALLWLAVLFGLVNALLGPLLHLIALPLTLLTFGLFALVVNGVLLAVTAGLSSHLDVSGFLGTILGAIVIALASTALYYLTRPLVGRRRAAHA